MRWVRYTAEDQTGYGQVEGDRIRAVHGDPFVGWTPAERWHDLAAVRIELPLEVRTFYCAGLNYGEHVRQVAIKRGEAPKLPTQPDMGYRATNALIAHDETVVIPADATDRVQYEGELVVVIGKRAKHLTPATALDCVLGYTIGNDVSERSWQASDRTLWRAKNTDTFKPMGPWIETDFDLAAAETVVRVNGAETTRFPTGQMLFDVVTFLTAMTRYLTLHPGDIVWMGTDGGSPNLVHGDVVEVAITGLGTLRNRFVREGA